MAGLRVSPEDTCSLEGAWALLLRFRHQPARLCCCCCCGHASPEAKPRSSSSPPLPAECSCSDRRLSLPSDVCRGRSDEHSRSDRGRGRSDEYSRKDRDWGRGRSDECSRRDCCCSGRSPPRMDTGEVGDKEDVKVLEWELTSLDLYACSNTVKGRRDTHFIINVLSALPTLCSTQCSPMNTIQSNPIDGYTLHKNWSANLD